MHDSTNIIIFAQIGSGKDSVAQLFLDFGQYVKGKLGEDIRKDVDNYTELLKLDKNERRRLYVEYGQMKREIFGKDIWCAILKHKTEALIKEGKLIVADGRQLNEYDYFYKNLGFIPIGIEANEELRKKRVIDRDGYDQSNQFNTDIENQAKQVIELIKKEKSGYIINNNGTVEDLIKQVKNILDEIKGIEREKFYRQYC